MVKFVPTHKIITADQATLVRHVLTGEDDNSAALYTKEEWDSCTNADWEIQENGRLTFQGKKPSGHASLWPIP